MEGDKYYGAKATINVWDPKIQQPNEFSLSQMWILGGSFGQDLNSIEAGWQVLLKKILHCHLLSANIFQNQHSHKDKIYHFTSNFPFLVFLFC